VSASGRCCPFWYRRQSATGSLKLDEAILAKSLAMNAATIDRLLRMPRYAAHPQKPLRIVSERLRRVALLIPRMSAGVAARY
jgi:hypothetical protein